MKTDGKTVTMTRDEYEIFSRMIDTMASQSEMISRLTIECNDRHSHDVHAKHQIQMYHPSTRPS